MLSLDTITTNTLVHKLQLLKRCGAKKTTQKTVNRECKRKGRICQNRTVRKDELFRGTSVAQIEKR